MTEARGGSEGRKTLGWSGGAVAERMEKSTMACSEEAHEFFLPSRQLFPLDARDLCRGGKPEEDGQHEERKEENKRELVVAPLFVSLSPQTRCSSGRECEQARLRSRLSLPYARSLSLSLSPPPQKITTLFFSRFSIFFF